MKHLSFSFFDKETYTKIQKKVTKKKYASILIQLYCGIIDKKKIQKILDKLQKDFPTATIIGATTAGEISHAKIYNQECIVSLSLFKKTKLKAFYTKKISNKDGEKVAKTLCNDDTKAMIVLGEGLKRYDYEAFLNGIKSVNPHIIIAGGLAGDNFNLEETFVFLGNEIYDTGAVSLSFSAKKLQANNKYNLNWIPIGKEFKITDVSYNVVHTIDNIPALEFFKKYLGKEVIEHSTLALPNFQLLFKEGSTTVARTPLAIEGESLVFAAPIPKGQKVQFGFSNEAAVISGSYNLRNELIQKPAEAIYIFSCIARKTLLGKTLEKEFANFEELAPTSGFFTYGEFYSTDANEALLNCTTTILILSEKQKKKKLQKNTINKATLDSITFNALSHFIKQTSIELKHNINLMNQYKQAVDVSALVSKTDTKGIITYVNDNFAKISKYTTKELLGKPHNIVRDPKVPASLFKKMWQTIQKGETFKGIFSNKAKDGSIYYVDATIMPIFDDDGNISEYIAIRQDITKQIKSKIRIQEKERLIRAIFDNQDSIVIHASKEKGMLSVNKKFFDYFDYKNFEDFKQKHKCICDLFLEEDGYVHPTSNPDWLEEFAHDEESDHKVKMRIKTNEVHTFNLKIKKIQNEYIINLYDITKLEEALQKAYSSEKAKAEFLANMSHEIRTPLNGILGFTDVLVKKDLPKDVKRYIDIIHKSGQTLLNIVNDILDFSKLESGELTLYETPTNLFEEMEASISTFASISKKKKINYYAYIDTNIPKVLKCDIQRLKQVMNNLISNAIKFTPEEGEVRVNIKLQNLQKNTATIFFSVKDTGIGIPQDKINTIFQAFSQADNSISRKFGGTGLGLAISNQYIQKMGSQIEVKSKENEGSEFYFTLDLEVVDPQSAVTKQENATGLNIAVMNSYEGIACGINDIVYTYLNGWNFSYDEIDGIEEIEQTPYDLLIVCAKFFDPQQCKTILDNHPKLHIIYIEGAETTLSCEHERFFIIEQPMTGSALFDKIISIIDPYVFDEENKQSKSIQNYHGKVLIAEDNETNQMLISVLLDEREVEYKIVENGQEAIDEIAQNDTYDLILMDINMPVLDGVSATKELRKRGYNKPIVSLSANVIESDIKSFKEAGVDATLNKPIIPEELDAILQEYLIQEQPKEEKPMAIPQEALDIINFDKITAALGIKDTRLINKLLNSLLKTLEKILNDIENGVFDKDLLHKLKGSVGNMRFEKLYHIADTLESQLDSLSTSQIAKAKEEVTYHIKHIISLIKEIQ